VYSLQNYIKDVRNRLIYSISKFHAWGVWGVWGVWGFWGFWVFWGLKTENLNFKFFSLFPS
jgi:hypothetical protein